MKVISLIAILAFLLFSCEKKAKKEARIDSFLQLFQKDSMLSTHSLPILSEEEIFTFKDSLDKHYKADTIVLHFFNSYTLQPEDSIFNQEKKHTKDNATERGGGEIRQNYI